MKCSYVIVCRSISGEPRGNGIFSYNLRYKSEFLVKIFYDNADLLKFGVKDHMTINFYSTFSYVHPSLYLSVCFEVIAIDILLKNMAAVKAWIDKIGNFVFYFISISPFNF